MGHTAWYRDLVMWRAVCRQWHAVIWGYAPFFSLYHSRMPVTLRNQVLNHPGELTFDILLAPYDREEDLLQHIPNGRV